MDHKDTDTPKLKVISGGRDTEKRKGRTGTKGTGTGLTEKQEQFARGLAEGLSNAEAYRAAYDAGDMQQNTIHSESCKLAQHPKISARVDALLAEKRARNSMLTEKQADRVWRNVWRLAEGEQVPPSVQQAALALAAKMAGMLTDRVEVKNENVDSKSIEAELLQRLQRLTG